MLIFVAEGFGKPLRAWAIHPTFGDLAGMCREWDNYFQACIYFGY